MRRWRAGALAVLLVAASACDRSQAGGDAAARGDDLVFVFPSPSDDMAVALVPTACGDDNPGCAQLTLGAPFPLATDPMPLAGVADTGLLRDGMGQLTLDSPALPPLDLWVPNTEGTAFNQGTVSRFDPGTVRELARYRSVTCSSNPDGSGAACDGAHGCCTLDDWGRYQARKLGKAAPRHEAVQLTLAYPPATGIDPYGNVFVANGAYGDQSSITRIATRPADCIDRNQNGRIDTSADSNGDGAIEVDCNGDGLPDDLAGVAQKPCTNGLAQEYFGLDDECVLWTSATFPSMSLARPLALAPNGSGGWDAWAGSYQTGQFVRVAAATGLLADDTQLPHECYGGVASPFTAVSDAQGIVWVAPYGSGKLCYFDSQMPASVGSARDPQWGQAQGSGIALDRDQGIWIAGGHIQRYQPDRSNGFASLGNGFWTLITGAPDGTAVAADSRSDSAWFVWACAGGQVLQIPASTITPLKSDQKVDSTGWPTIAMPCLGVGVDGNQDVWGVDEKLATRALVDAMGNVTQPVVDGAPQGGNLCPAGDSCPTDGAEPYSDFTGFGGQHFGTLVEGRYDYVFRSTCLDQMPPADTHWVRMEWDAVLPMGTELAASARSGAVPTPDKSWDAGTVDVYQSPLSLAILTDGPGYLQAEFNFTGAPGGASPTLSAVRLFYECGQ